MTSESIHFLAFSIEIQILSDVIIATARKNCESSNLLKKKEFIFLNNSTN